MNNMMFPLKSIEDERMLRLNTIKNNGAGVKEHFLCFLEGKFDKNDNKKIIHAYDFTINIEYKHEGLCSDAYLAHPLRVAEMIIGTSNVANSDYVILALLHNILEVSNVEKKLLEDEFGELISGSIATLTVNREKQNDSAYKDQYYKAINNGYDGMKVVKVLDKLDNLFILGTNPDSDVRVAYMNEIRQYVIPLANCVLPNAVEYFNKLLENTKNIGSISKK